MDEDVQQNEYQHGYIEIPANAEDINIFNKKLQNDIYVPEEDSSELEK